MAHTPRMSVDLFTFLIMNMLFGDLDVLVKGLPCVCNSTTVVEYRPISKTLYKSNTGVKVAPRGLQEIA